MGAQPTEGHGRIEIQPQVRLIKEIVKSGIFLSCSYLLFKATLTQTKGHFLLILAVDIA